MIRSAKMKCASVSHKDALAWTIPKRRRGAIMGLAASVASISVFGVGLFMAAGIFKVDVRPLAAIIAVARAAFMLAAAIFVTLRDPQFKTDADREEGTFTARVNPIMTDPHCGWSCRRAPLWPSRLWLRPSLSCFLQQKGARPRAHLNRW